MSMFHHTEYTSLSNIQVATRSELRVFYCHVFTKFGGATALPAFMVINIYVACVSPT